MSETPPLREDWARCEVLIKRFEDAWRRGERPAIEGYLDVPPALRPALLVELVHTDLELRLRAGEYARVEDYLERHPELGDNRAAVLDLVASEFTLRNRWQMPAWPEEFFLRFPEYLSDLPIRLGREPPTLGRGGALRGGVPAVPGFAIIDELGRGGMGVVYCARQVGLNRVVALKTLVAGPAATAADCAYLRREAEAIARLDHPNIVPIHQVGEHAGLPFLVMKYFPGGSLAEHPGGAGTDPARHAGLVEVVARAVHHAHQRGILHRDLKPSNILLDEQGNPHVADFGLARALDQPGGHSSTIVGTPSYMAPEQARHPSAVTTAVDVYGLGAVLYERLTGVPPFHADSPLATLEQLVSDPPLPPRQLHPRIPRDLEIITLKCLDKDPARRYASAAELADDLERWRTGRAILARPAGALERAGRWLRRHPVLAATALVGALALACIVLILAESNRRITARERETSRALEQERLTRRHLDQALNQQSKQLYLQRVALAGRLLLANQPGNAFAHLDASPGPFRHWEWRYLSTLRRVEPIVLVPQAGTVSSLAFGANGLLALGSQDGAVQLWDVAKRTRVHQWQAHGGPIDALGFSADGATLATVSAVSLKLWQVRTGTLVRTLPGGRWLAFHPDGRRIASGGGRSVKIWDSETGKEVLSLPGHANLITAGAFRSDGEQLAVADTTPSVRIWEVGTGKPAAGPWRRGMPVNVLAWTPEGRLLIEASASRIDLTHVGTGATRRAVDDAAYGRARFALGPDGLFAYTAIQQTVRLRRYPAGRDVLLLQAERRGTTEIACSRDGRWLAVGSLTGHVLLWDVSRLDMQELSQPQDAVTGLAFQPDGQRLAIALAEGPRAEVRLLDVATGQVVRRLAGQGDVAFHPRQPWLATGSRTGVALWHRETGEMRRSWKVDQPITRLGFALDGQLLLVGTARGELLAFELTVASPARRWNAHRGPIQRLVVRPRSNTLASVGGQGDVALWDAATGRRLGERVIARGYHGVSFLPDGSLATACTDRLARLLDREGRIVRSYMGHVDAVHDIACSPDGQRLVTASEDGAVRIWDMESAQELLLLPGPTAPVRRILWSPDGQRIVALDRVVRLWQATAAPQQGEGPFPGTGGLPLGR